MQRDIAMKSICSVLKILPFFLILLTGFFQIASADIIFSEMRLISKERVDRFNYDYTYKLEAENTGNSAVSDVQTSIILKPSGASFLNGTTRVVDARVNYGLIQGKTKALSQDVFIIRHNRRFPFIPEDLDFVFSVRNAVPVVSAGTDQSLSAGQTVTLQGNATDPDFDALTYEWKLLSKPANSSATISDPDSINASFLADKAGIYIAQLVASDGETTSAPDVVRISVSEMPVVLTREVVRAYGVNPDLSDSDQDGLADHFEILKGFPFLDPAKSDTDGNGTNDDAEDTDQDGLSNLAENDNNTHPLIPDTDGDGLSDGDEVLLYFTNPKDPDSDQDGLPDGYEINAGSDPNDPDTDDDGTEDSKDILTTVKTSESGVSVALTATGYVADELVIQEIPGTNSRFHSALGQIGKSYEITLSESATQRLQNAKVTLPYQPGDIESGDPDNLQVFTFDEELKFWIPASSAHQLDTANRTVSADVSHFSRFAVFDIKNWNEQWTAVGSECSSRNLPVDTALVIDSSGSMRNNDPDNLRLQASKNFVNALLETDRGAVVDFDNRSTILSGLTSSKSTLNNAINAIDSSGGTNIGAGVSDALNILKAAQSNERGQLLVLLTDGQGRYSSGLTTQAANDNVTIYTIGLSNGVNASLLNQIAVGTGGTYNQVNSAADLPRVFRSVEIDSGLAGGEDTDGDGLTDQQEIDGITDVTGTVFTSDPDNPDTDGDGLTDLEEVGRPLSLENVKNKLKERGINVDLDEEKCYYDVVADPGKKDTDGDGLEDGLEVDGGDISTTSGAIVGGISDPRVPDTDGDGVGDEEEFSWSTKPRLPDTDFDGYSDAFEIANLDKGFHPLEFTVVKDWKVYAWEFSVGALCGDICNLDEIPELVGQITAATIPVAGTVRDVIDALALLFQGEFVGAGITVIGVIPAIGDTAAAAGKIGSFAARNLNKADEIIQMISKADWAPLSLKRQVLDDVGKLAFRGSLEKLLNSGFDQDTLLRLAKGKVTRFEDLAAMVSRPRARVAKGSKFFEGKNGWREAEVFLRAGTGKPLAFPPIPPPRDFIRYPDAVVNRVGKEAKTGYVRNTARIKKQIEKDAKLVMKGDLAGAEWHFFPSGRSDSIGADKTVLDLLDRNGIPYVFHIP